MPFRRFGGIALVSVVLAFLAAPRAPLGAEENRPTRKPAGKFDLKGVADREAVMLWVDFPPGAAESPHYHDAEVFTFVTEGSVTFEIDGAPTVTLKAGETTHVLPRQVHSAKNASATAPAQLAVVFVAEKGKPLTTPVK